MIKIDCIDNRLIVFFRSASEPFSRISLYIVYFWFGILKILGMSPANPLVVGLLKETLPFISFNQFIVYLGLLEIVIGALFLIPGLERLAIFLFFAHLIMIFAPLILLPMITWQYLFVPTLEGQYIIKNLITVALVFNLAGKIKPSSE